MTNIILDLNIEPFNTLIDSNDVYLEVNDSDTITTEYPTFTEIIDGENHTKIYYTEIDLEVGSYFITIKHPDIESGQSKSYNVTHYNYNLIQENIMHIIRNDTGSTSFR